MARTQICQVEGGAHYALQLLKEVKEPTPRERDVAAILKEVLPRLRSALRLILQDLNDSSR